MICGKIERFASNKKLEETSINIKGVKIFKQITMRYHCIELFEASLQEGKKESLIRDPKLPLHKVLRRITRREYCDRGNLGGVWFDCFLFSFSLEIKNGGGNAFGWIFENIFSENIFPNEPKTENNKILFSVETMNLILDKMKTRWQRM